LAATPVQNLTIDQRLKRLEAALANQNMVDLFLSLERLQKEVETLRGQFEVLNHQMKSLQEQNQQLYLTMDQRIEDVENSVTSLSGQVSVLSTLKSSGFSSPSISGGTGTGALGASPPTGTNTLQAQSVYQKALTLLKEKKYGEAAGSFQQYILTFPQDTNIDNARYWMGEAYFAMRDFDRAITEFKTLIDKHPKSPKVPGAWLKIGFSYYEMKDWDKSQEALNTVIAKFPNNPASRLAERRLTQMRQQGKL
jgi:tol-pal system protein YbgF